jgi:PEGA domain
MRTARYLSVAALWLLGAPMWAANPIFGEVELQSASRTERDAGVWLDGQYVGYVRDLSGNGKLVLVPGEHRLLFKLIGYQDLGATIAVEPGGATKYRVTMSAADNVTYPERDATARLRIAVEPDDAAIFVNDTYVGHVDRFNGRRGMRIAPGTYRFTVALPGYEAFETQLTLRANQTYEIKTALAKGRLDQQAGELLASSEDGAGSE